MDDEPQMHWHWTYWVAIVVGAGLWVGLWYGIGALLYFILSLK